MKTELVVALIAGAFSMISVIGTIWSSIWNANRSDKNARAIEQLNVASRREQEMSKFREPLARSAYDLQSRLYNILRRDLIGVHLNRGSDRAKSYVIENTTFLIGQYLCWAELIRRDIQFIDLGEHSKTRELSDVQDRICSLWGADRLPSVFRIFAGEQRAIGEALIQAGAQGPECIGYGAFLNKLGSGTNPLIDSLRMDVTSLSDGLAKSTERLTELQHALIDLLMVLDHEHRRFRKDRISKV